jgi:tRNA(Ile)-lysidine synthase
MDLLELVQTSIERHSLLQKGERLVAAVSGGPDSLCLLDCLHRLGYQPIVAHFDHAIREGSAGEAQQVKQLAEQLGLTVELGRVDVPAERGGRGSLEEVGRLHRYRFLVGVAQRQGVRAVATGHTADDQVETVLMHLLRGAGPAGLRGMLPASDLGDWVGVPGGGVRLIRPLLAVRRSEVEAHCATRRLTPLSDPSNLDLSHFRNRLRRELLPILEGYSPGVRLSLWRTAQIMAAEQELIEQLTDAAWHRVIREAGPGCLAFDREALLQEPVALQRAMLRRAVQRLRPGLRDVGFEAVESALRLAAEPSDRRTTLVGGLDWLNLREEVVLRWPDALIHFPWLPQLEGPEPRPLPVPGAIELAQGWGLQLERIELASDQLARLMTGEMRREAAIDAAQVRGALSLRSPHPGDRIYPLGMDGSVKLADLFLQRNIPWPARERWPVVVDDHGVVWAAGLHLSRLHRLTAQSAEAISMRLVVQHERHAPSGMTAQ